MWGPDVSEFLPWHEAPGSRHNPTGRRKGTVGVRRDGQGSRCCRRYGGGCGRGHPQRGACGGGGGPASTVLSRRHLSSSHLVGRVYQNEAER